MPCSARHQPISVRRALEALPRTLESRGPVQDLETAAGRGRLSRPQRAHGPPGPVRSPQPDLDEAALVQLQRGGPPHTAGRATPLDERGKPGMQASDRVYRKAWPGRRQGLVRWVPAFPSGAIASRLSGESFQTMFSGASVGGSTPSCAVSPGFQERSPPLVSAGTPGATALKLPQHAERRGGTPSVGRPSPVSRARALTCRESQGAGQQPCRQRAGWLVGSGSGPLKGRVPSRPDGLVVGGTTPCRRAPRRLDPHGRGWL